ncbi:MAG: ABC transporter permease [Rhodospirillaceae bacterium]|jgi:putative spermidine/putrescine transport system permease protein|nr:ABC transporter permease [Rhodospirillaceae bacterium]MBT5195152.1 ABC transporter permease [Rhodospirillaceae bacterium]MBT5898911.1 ABC transporter permease [Rhodospirillaceae bacterium]MBT6430046.1 ABC transporter permease [Rhodospirillaceae bacterium]MBT7760028.1 ABC transporter permease [Rhodospirillaceae bacterium]
MSKVDDIHHSGLIGSQPPPAHAAAQAKIAHTEEGFPTAWLITPATIWLILFLVIPLVSIIVFSFWENTPKGLEPAFSLDFYGEYFYTKGFFDPEADRFLLPSVFLRTLGSTIYFTLVTMVLCLIVGYPIAYFLAMQVQAFKWQLALFLLCMVPFWTSYLIRAVAWLPMLGRRGLINQALIGMGIVDKPVSFLFYSEFGYTLALVQIYVVLGIGPIFFSLAKIDKAILEAALDMGATPFQIFREIIGPMSLPGVAIGMIFIFVVIMGEFATAVVVYGGKTSTAGTVILNYYGIANYPFAAVNALMLMLAMVIGIVVILRIVDIRKEL